MFAFFFAKSKECEGLACLYFEESGAPAWLSPPASPLLTAAVPTPRLDLTYLPDSAASTSDQPKCHVLSDGQACSYLKMLVNGEAVLKCEKGKSIGLNVT